MIKTYTLFIIGLRSTNYIYRKTIVVLWRQNLKGCIGYKNTQVEENLVNLFKDKASQLEEKETCNSLEANHVATSSHENSTKRKTFSFKSLAVVFCSTAFFYVNNTNSFLSIKCEHAVDQSSCLVIVCKLITP